MGYDGKSLFECVHCPICICRQLPLYRNFTIGKDNTFEYIIDAMKVTDNLREAMTSFSPILSDTTEYHMYLVLSGAGCSLEEIKAYAKVMNVNYFQEKQVLTQKRNLIAAGSAYDMWNMLDRLEHSVVHYVIESEYPYE